jgi:hypothetical protein
VNHGTAKQTIIASTKLITAVQGGVIASKKRELSNIGRRDNTIWTTPKLAYG